MTLPDADAAGEHVTLIFQHKAGFAAAEQFGEDAAKVLVDGPEAVGEDVFHLARQAGDHPGQLVPAALDVLHLSAEGVVAGLDLLILLDGADIDVAQSAYLAPQVGHLRPEDVHVLELHAELFGLREGQLILVPELRGHLVVFALGGGFPLRQTGHLAAHL